MDPYPKPEQSEIERLRDQLKRKDEDLRLAWQQIFQLQSSSRPPSYLTSFPSPSVLERYAEAHGDTQLPVVRVEQNVLPGATSIPRSTGGKLHSRRHVDPRTAHQYQNGDEPHPHAMKRPRTMSQQTPASQKMDRAASNLSTRSAGPFTGNAVSPPPTFQTDHGNYATHNGLVPAQHPAGLMEQISADGQQQPGAFDLTEIPTLPATSVLVDPGVWLAANEALSPGFVPFPSAPHQRDMDVPNLNTGVSVCDSMTSGATYDNTAPMTRENSQFGDLGVGGVRMVNMGSQMSQGRDTYLTECPQQTVEYGDTSPYLGKPSYREDALFAVGSSLATLAGHHCAPTAPDNGLLMSPDMERSLSTDSSASAKSTTSLSARAKDTLKQQNQRAQNAPLKPKPSVDENKPEPPSDEKNDGKAPITKTPYVRPRQPKVFCELCNEHKEGFRGEHELRRHKDAKHQSRVKKFICVDPQELGLPVNVQVVNPLSGCKACTTKKKYGAYYNAAAHLRRTHFKEKPSRSKNKNSGANGGDDDKRGGKGGGDWPSMHELKNWMQETYVRQDEQRPGEDGDADDEIDSTQPFLSDAETNTNPLTINTINTDMTYLGTMPLSSADFTFNGAANMPLGFSADMTEYSAVDPMHPLSATVSSSATVTPLTIFNDAQHHQFDNVGYQYAT